MAGISTLDYAEIKRQLIAMGYNVTSVQVEVGRLTIHFNCSKCGKPHQILYNNFNKGQNPDLLCRDCQVMTGPKMKRVKDYFEKMNVPIKRIDTSTKHWNIYFPCAKCGTEVKILDDYVGKNNKELCCKHCRNFNTVPKQEDIAALFESKGSELLSEYVNNHQPVKFRCTKCGSVGEIAVSHVKSGDFNPNLWCDKCRGKSDVLGDLKQLLQEKGSELVGEFTNIDYPVDVLCTCCGNPFKFSYGNYKYLGQNENIICKDCRMKALQSDPGYLGSCSRPPIDISWLNWSLEFFNIYGKEKKLYSAHHIIRYRRDLDRRTSFVNVFPLKKDLHVKNNHYYHYEDGMDITNWTGVEKLPYHNYSGFKFLDLNSKCITEILFPETSMSMNFLYNRKKDFADQGILYLPFFLHEVNTQEKRALVFSMIRARLYSQFPDIYRYTGVELKKFYARKLKVVSVSHVDAANFFKANHIQGAVNSAIYLGLVTDDGLMVSCMAVSKPRASSEYDYEITRFANLINSCVVGGASKLFKHFVDDYDPKSVVSFCDLRFSSLDPNETVYPKLGFEYVSYSDPNYGYRNPDTGEVRSRRSYQKSMLEDKLDVFDSDLSEFQNMEMNGFVRLVDCGNFKYVWIKN